MSIIGRNNDAESLAGEIVTAREKYNATVNSVLDRVVARRQVVGQTIVDLQDEDAALARVQESAQESR